MPSNVGVAIPVGNWPQVNNVADSMNLNRLGLPPALALEEQALNRRQQLANVLMQRGLQPAQGQMVGRFYSAPSWAQGLAQLGTAAAGAGLNYANDLSRKDLADESQNILSASLQKYRDSIAPQEVQTKAADTRSVNGSGVEPGLPYGIDPHTMPSQGWDINTYQPDTTQQVQDNKNAIALNTPSPQEPPLAGTFQNIAGQGPQDTPLVDALQQRYDQGEQYTRQPFSQPQSQVTVSGAESAMQERTPEQKQQALVELMASQHPQAQAIAQALMKQQEAQQAQASQREFLAGEHALDRDVRREGIQASTEMKIAQIDNTAQLTRMQIQSAEQARQDSSALKEQLAKLERQKDIEVAKIGAAAKTDTAHIKADAAVNKPMPASALRMQQEELDTIGMVAGINADLKAIEGQIDSGKLQLGMVDNLLSRGKNAVGLSDENSRNFASFKSTMEKQRNDSLRLNKGVQTEGDATRAWNELFENINDKAVVKQRLQEIQRINERAANVRKMNVDVIRQNYGQDALETSGYSTQPAAVGQGGSGGLSKEEQSELETLRKKYGR
jgi:hypothetical protein